MTKQEQARKRIEALEKNPKYNKTTPENENKLREANLDDPRQNKEGAIDKKWHQDANGN